MKKDSDRQWFTLDELVGTLNKSLDAANQRIMSGEVEAPFSICEFSVDLEVYSRGGTTEAGEQFIHFSFPTGEEIPDNNSHASSRISIRLKPTLIVKQ